MEEKMTSRKPSVLELIEQNVWPMNGNITEIAKKIGYSRQTVHNYLDQYPYLRKMIKAKTLDEMNKERNLGEAKMVEDIESNIVKSMGNISVIAERVGVSRQTIYNYIKKHPHLMDLIEQERETISDQILNSFYNNAISGNTTAQIFYLKTQHGWKETTNLNLGQNPDAEAVEVVVNWSAPKPLDD